MIIQVLKWLGVGAVLYRLATLVDLSITAANVDFSDEATFITGTAGATVTAGQPVYKASDGKYDPGDRTSATAYDVVGIAAHGASDGQPLKIGIRDPDLDLGATLVVGTVYCLSDSGNISPVADLLSSDYVVVLGVARTASSLEFGPIIKDVLALVP